MWDLIIRGWCVRDIQAEDEQHGVLECVCVAEGVVHLGVGVCTVRKCVCVKVGTHR